MTYTPYLIANYSTGLDKRLQPWLIPDDAQEELLDGFVYRGVMSKREGYNYFATGDKGGAPYRESRIVHTLTAVAMIGAINGINMVFTLAGTAQIARGSVTINGSNPVQTFTDNGLGFFMDGFVQIGTVNYITGAISITLPLPPLALSTVTVTYSFMPGNPVMMVANYTTTANVKELIVADTQYINRYNAATNTLVDITSTPYTGNKFQFFSWTNYADAADVPRLIFTNNFDVIQEYDGTTVANYGYTLTGVAALKALLVVDMKDRLILLRTTEDGVVFPKRIRISGTGANSDVFDTTATGAGFIDIPDGSWIQGAAFNRDDLIIFTEMSTWVMKYTGNDTSPFILEKIDESRGSDAPFAAITYLNRTSAVSKRGLIISDGYRVERQDEDIPDFTYKEVDGTNFALCFAGVVDADRDHYLLYPPAGSSTSRRILVTNYEEDNYATYRLPLSCMGTFITPPGVTWNDLLIYPNWDAFAAVYGNWNSFGFDASIPFSIGGGHNGEIWKLAVTESEDNPVRIYNITVIDASTIEVTTDFNNYSLNLDDTAKGADFIYLTGILGMQEVNNQQFPIISITSGNVFRLDVSTVVVPATSFTAYTSGGRANRVIPFSSLFKKFNPYADQDKKVRCGWLYMYVDSSGTDLQRNIIIDSITNANPCVVSTEVDHSLHTGDQVTFFGIGGTTQLNGTQAFITVLTPTSFSLDGIDSTAYGVYTSGGYVGVGEAAKMSIDIITNDVGHKTQLNNASQDPYQGNVTNMTFEDGGKKWYKVFINQVGKFIQFRLRNQQAGAKINIQATMPGFQPIGRLI